MMDLQLQIKKHNLRLALKIAASKENLTCPNFRENFWKYVLIYIKV